MLVIRKILSTSVLISFLYPGVLEAGGENVQTRICTTRSTMHRHIKKTGPCPWGDYNLIYYMDCSSALQEKKKSSFYRKDQECSSKPWSEREGCTLIFTCFGSARHNSWTHCWLCTHFVCSLIINLERTFSQGGDWMINVPESCLEKMNKKGFMEREGQSPEGSPADRVQWVKVRGQ